MDVSDRRKRIAEEAAEWWVLMQDDVTRIEHEQYVDWLRESSAHVAEMLRIAQVHGALEQFDRWSSIPTDGTSDDRDTVIALPRPPPGPQRTRISDEPSSRRLSLAWAVVATVLLVSALPATLVYRFKSQVIQTERAERREVALADGSVVQVDPETLLRVKFERNVRRVFLERGRALFRVAKNPDRPFLVQTEGTTVRAVGTAFAVERQPQSVVVTVAEGKVAVISTATGSSPPSHPPASSGASQQTARGEGATLTAPESTGKWMQPYEPLSTIVPSERTASEVLLTANEQVTVDQSGSAETVRTVNSERALAWAEGRLIFDNEPLGDAIKKFNHYNRIQISIGDTILASRPISGVFSTADPESFVAFIGSVVRVHVTRSDGADIRIDSVK